MPPVHVHIPFQQIRDYRDFLRARKYDLEIYFAAAVLSQVERQDIEDIARSLDWNPSLSVHAPFMDLNPGAVDPMVRAATQLRFRQFLDAAAVLKPRAAVFHAAWDRWRYGGRVDIWLENSLETWAGVMETASRIGLKVAVENVFDEDPEALGLLIERIGSPDFGFCFDTGHFNLFSKVPMERWFERLGHRVLVTHLHDNDGTSDAHRALGTGAIDFDAVFRLLGQYATDPVYTVEAHDRADIDPSLERVRAHLAGGPPTERS